MERSSGDSGRRGCSHASPITYQNLHRCWSAILVSLLALPCGVQSQGPHDPVEICKIRRQQGATDEQLDKCGHRWAIKNDCTVHEFWEVQEIKYYWDSGCTIQVPFKKGNTFQSTIMSTMQDNTGEKAFDDDLSTMWSANCRVLMGGCQYMMEHVGIDHQGYLPVNMDPTKDYSNVRCVKIYQTINATRYAPKVALVTWANESDYKSDARLRTSNYHVVARYGDMMGGAWQKRPATDLQLWRLWNYVPTEAPWTVAEFMFYSDAFCTKQAHGTVISSQSFWPVNCVDDKTCDTYVAANTIDGIIKQGREFPEPLPTVWKADCSVHYGCDAQVAWIGLDFAQTPVKIQCIRIFQPYPHEWPLNPPTYASSMLLQGWDGYEWVDYDTFANLDHGVWNDTQPVYKAAWRVSNYDPISDGWLIHELAFHDEENCGVPGPSGRAKDRIPGVPINSNPALIVETQWQECRKMEGDCADLAFDTKTDTAWRSHCTNCDQHDAWIGMMFRGRTGQEVKCIRLFQGSELKHLTDSVQLSYWDGSRWTKSRLEVGMSAGTWNVRPALPGSMWRLYGVSATALPWTIIGFTLYTDTQCKNKAEGTQLACGSHLSYPVAEAFDDNEETQWEASCVPPARGHPGCTSGSAWIGMQDPLGTFNVKCLAVQQHRSRSRQVSRAMVQIWDGVGYIPSRDYTLFDEMGGGAWQNFPGSLGSMWRFIAQPHAGGQGFGVTEMSLFSLPACSGEPVQVGWPNIVPMCSAYASAREVAQTTGHDDHLLAIGDWGMTSPSLAFDGNLETFWADITSTHQAWIGLDMVSQVADLHCVKFALPSVFSLQPQYAELQVWDGHVWITKNMVTSAWKSLPLAIQEPYGVGFQRRPIMSMTMWRLESQVFSAGWEVIELEFYPYGDCSGDVYQGQAISSVPRARISGDILPGGGQIAPFLAFDGNVHTRWTAACPDGGCKPGDAWIGLDMGEPSRVSCLRLMQTGRRDLTAETVALSKWDGHNWHIEDTYKGMGGNSWNTRPAAADSMWRIVFVEYLPGRCPEHGGGMFQRSWGVSELELYSDDDCTTKLPGVSDGATVIASGTREPNPIFRTTADAFSPLNAFDGNTKTFWAAQCGHMPGNDEARCQDGKEWIGLDFREVDEKPRDVRCIRVHQNRAPQRECCDPAEKMRLERWNGTDWSVIEWRHIPSDYGPAMHVAGTFTNLGICKAGGSDIAARGSDYWEKRSRRQSDQCVLPQSTAVRLLSDPLCDKHDGCADAGFTGKCCPMIADIAISRCCCDFLMKGRVFEDEYEKDILREIIGMHPILGLEYAVIRSSLVLPTIGVALAIIVYILANIPSPNPNSGCCRYRSWHAICQPLQAWLDGPSYAGGVVAFFVVLDGGSARKAILKALAWLVLGCFFGGIGFWLLISYLVAEVFIKLTVLMSLVINLAKSPYKPHDSMDLRRMQAMSAAGLKVVSNTLSFGGVGNFCQQTGAGVVMFVTYVCRAAFDFVLMRFSLMSLGLVDEALSVPEILYHFPTFDVDLRDLMDAMYTFVGASGTGFQETFRALFSGVPTCEGPVVLFSGMWLVGVTLLLIRWLNYDFFGIFMATKQCVGMTRPTFQKCIGIGMVLGFQGGLFLFMQCIMLIFTRALKLVNPLDESNQQWTCPYEDGLISILVGRTFLIVSAVIALVITFLCANGHFLGQDYIVSEFSQYVGMDLRKLDPDGVGSEGGLIRFDTFLAMIPTTFGIWIDRWNVDGFLIKQRAQVYATELNLPLACAVCGEYHAPYHEVMRATGMQLSLAYQLIPAGALVGKACEYLNNPPLFYCGSKLKCYHARRYMQYSLQGAPKKLHCGQFILVWSGLILAFFKERFFPFLVRLCGLATYVLLVYYTVEIDSKNVATAAKNGFTYVVIACLAKVVFEFELPSVSIMLLGVVLHYGPVDHYVDPDKGVGKPARKPPLIGQIMCGIITGSSVAVYMLVEDPWELPWEYDALCSVAAGVLFSVLAVAMASLTEACPASRFSATCLMLTYQLGVAAGASWLLSTPFERLIRFTIGTCMVVLLCSIAGFTFKPAPSYHGHLIGQSAVLPLVVSARALCGPIGSACGVFCVTLLHKTFTSIEGLPEIAALGIIVAIATFVGLVFGLASDKIIEQRAPQIAIPPGVLVAILIGIFWHWLPGLAIGVFLIIIVGAYVEYRVSQRMLKQTILLSEYEQRLGMMVSPTDAKGLPTLCTSASQKTIADLPSSSKSWIDNGEQETKALTDIRDLKEPSQVWVRPPKAAKRYTMGQSKMLGGEWSKGVGSEKEREKLPAKLPALEYGTYQRSSSGRRSGQDSGRDRAQLSKLERKYTASELSPQSNSERRGLQSPSVSRGLQSPSGSRGLQSPTGISPQQHMQGPTVVSASPAASTRSRSTPPSQRGRPAESGNTPLSQRGRSAEVDGNRFFDAVGRNLSGHQKVEFELK